MGDFQKTLLYWTSHTRENVKKEKYEGIKAKAICFKCV